MLTQNDAQDFARQWVEAWNRHDLDAIMRHYSNNVAFTSPFVVAIAQEPTGTLHGTSALRMYFDKALKAFPILRFELLDVLVGVGSVTLYYRSVKERLAAEVMHVNEQGLIDRVGVHYREAKTTSI
jgi:hypothetical protein